MVDPGHPSRNGSGSGHSSLWPEHLRSDNGPEFIAYCMQDWLKAQQIKTLYIKPGSPWENGHIESFHDKLRDECANAAPLTAARLFNGRGSCSTSASLLSASGTQAKTLLQRQGLVLNFPPSSSGRTWP
jgi:transposase InsO family protein